MANEDTSLEIAVCAKLRPRNVLAVSGSGSRCLSLLCVDSIEKLMIVDLAESQIFIAQLRLQLIKALSFEEYLQFWGYPPFHNDNFKEMRKKVIGRLSLSDEAREYLTDTFQKSSWEKLLYLGKWEQTFITFSKAIKLLLGKHVNKIFSFTNLDDQRRYIKEDFPSKRFSTLLNILGNKKIFNFLLYKGGFVKKNISASYLEYYQSAFQSLFTHDLANKSFFLQLCFLGGIHLPEGIIPEGRKENFTKVKNQLQHVKVEFIVKDLIQAVEESSELDFVSMSNVPSYFSGEVEKSFLAKSLKSLSEGGVILLRNYLRKPDADRSGYQNISQMFNTQIKDEKVQMYDIEILKKDS